MIDQYNDDGTGWARFSDDMTMRYRLARVLSGKPLAEMLPRLLPGEFVGKRVVFLMLNPSTADAFKLDSTIKRCVGFARAWGADVLEVVNIFALRSTDPDALYARRPGNRGDDPTNDQQIVDACTGAMRVVAGWGKHGALDERGRYVRRMLDIAGIALHHLGTNKDGSPKHPLYLKGGIEPQELAL